MIEPQKIRELTLQRADGAENSTHISAASSLVRHREILYVVADDEVQLGVFPLDGEEHGYMVRILDEHLSEDTEERKEEKPDFESALIVPPFGDAEHGGLLALGSGSGDLRRKGAIVPLDADGRPRRGYKTIELGDLYDALKSKISEVNIEGASVVGSALRLLQRGNEPGTVNAHIDLELEPVLDALDAGSSLPPGAIADIVEQDLGDIEGVKLCFADSSVLDDGRQIFAASAESAEKGSDGKVTGSAIGVMTPEGEVSLVERLAGPILKVEGLTARERDDHIQVLMVTDADDPSVPSPLYEARLPLEAGR